MSPLPKAYVFGEDKLKEKYFANEKLMPETFKLSFLQKYNQTPLSEKENELLHKYFGYKNTDELMLACNIQKLMKSTMNQFDKIVNKLSALEKLIKIVSDDAEKERINNLIKGVGFTLDYVASLDDSEPDFSDYDFNETKGS